MSEDKNKNFVKKLRFWLYTIIGIMGFAYILIAFIILENGKKQIQQKIQNSTGNISNIHSVCVGSGCFDIELALTPTQHRRGLMNRDYMPNGSGMLFVFQNKGVHKFWMKNTSIPLDIIWIKDDGNGIQRVFHIEQNVQPCPEIIKTSTDCVSVGPDQSTEYVLELNANSVETNNIYIGSQINFIF